MARYWTTLKDLQQANMIDNPADLSGVAEHFQIRISPAMQALMDHDATNPIYQQFIPSSKEGIILDDEVSDPIGDIPYTPVTGIVHRYQDRALLKVTQLCAVYCRFCFRKEMIGQYGESLSRDELEDAFTYIESHPELWEIILTGGDPLILSVNRLTHILTRLARVPHLQNIRIHTRIPVVAPEMITDELLTLFSHIQALGKTLTIVIHANHADELTDAVAATMKRLQQNGIMLISQSVMLRGINDDFETLAALMRRFIAVHIKPYYLHQLDFARGTSHFRVPEEKAVALIRELRLKLSGICVPVLIQEIPHGKKPLF